MARFWGLHVDNYFTKENNVIKNLNALIVVLYNTGVKCFEFFKDRVSI